MGELFAEFGLLRGGGFERAGFASDEGEHLRQVLRLDEHFAGLRAFGRPDHATRFERVLPQTVHPSQLSWVVRYLDGGTPYCFLKHLLK